MRRSSRFSRWFLLCLLAVAVLLRPFEHAAAVVPQAPPAVVPDQQTYEAVDAFLQEQMAAIGLPGAAVVVVQDGVPVHAAAYGSADNSGRPMTVDTPVLLASTSKSLTAIAVMQQVEAGRLRLDEPVRTYLPWFTLQDSRASAITVRHLLHQASGMASKDTAFEGSFAQHPQALEEGVRDLADSPLAGVPGAAFGYANANFNVLGLLVQTVSGQPFGDYMRQHVFDPLDMSHSHATRAAALADGAAAGHSLWFGTFWQQTEVPAPTTGMPSSTMYASANDLGRELSMLLDEGQYRDGRILQPDSVRAMLKPGVRVDGSKMYAMGWFTRPLVESVPAAEAADNASLPLLAEHQGEWGNSHTYLAMVPSTRLGVALVINANDTSAPSRLKAIDTNILRILHGQQPIPAVVQEDWLQRYSWAVALGLLVAELLSLWLALGVLLRSGGTYDGGGRLPLLAAGLAALALDAFALWLCFIYAPARFDTGLLVIIRQFPDVGVSLVPVLGLAILWAVPRTVWLLIRALRPGPHGVT
ncbi:class A beta-lactamase-related serine hydrolase [Arthrobacter sp. RT-1]|uniref:serine hydrolase domain-containing protein n=1 Tax=Arthrobacter sp. RT-1 TaxID=2292263 RepID=UPI000E1EC32F|nr:serine hydrolase domain-containing protein [Arthrobacter sp. RT-1]RDV08604.1 class A beta-lactamase-related serine hydrolase [Arthrobacter sp. RT-1]